MQESIAILDNKASIAVNPTCVQPTNVASETPGHAKESQPVPSTSDQHGTLLHHASKPTSNTIDNSVDRKFNIVIYGVKESPKGTQKNARTKLDIDSCVQILKQANDDISVQSIRDCLRLGKYNPTETRPRPLLAKLSHVFDVDTVLYNRSKITNGIQVKPDMNREEKQRESLLLKEHWSLICSGIDKKYIKIRGTKLYVKNQLHGEVMNSVFVLKPVTKVLSPSDNVPDNDAVVMTSPNNDLAMELEDRPAASNSQ